MSGFKAFLFRGNVVDLAVAVVIGAAFGAVVTAFVKDLITPIVAALVGQARLRRLGVHDQREPLRLGDFLNAVISFVLIAAAIYFVVIVPLERIGRLHDPRPGRPSKSARFVSRRSRLGRPGAAPAPRRSKSPGPDASKVPRCSSML